MKFTNVKIQVLAKSSFWLFIFAYLLIGQLALPGFVLCLDISDHIAFEPSINKTQCGTFNDKGSSDLGRRMVNGEDHCGRCLDMPISDEYSSIITTFAYDMDFDIQASYRLASPSAGPALDKAYVRNTFPQIQDFISPTVPSLQASILLC